MARSMTLKPRMSEKAYGMSQIRNTYVFEVPKEANKHEVAVAVAKQFDVTVETVNITLTKGKVKRTYRRGGRPVVGRDNDVKKAYVRIKAGDTIPVFAAEEVAQADNEKATKKAKKEAK